MPPFREYVDCLLRLYAERVAGRGEGHVAESIREEMDAHWQDMSKTEMELARRLSAALNLCTHG